ncbi:kunitz-type protease inhibitor 4 isoform X2 [Cuculus canorus]|uniref:kunitz-type protease inhibitor 4 isoform X2 n=1 Tax=Cuculus canorus TaxID=55661 RepID=UPI0023AA657A|nr:kunitz-type protease inhibitor 4 isoform X2 [Cuculus canorus]
MVRSGPTPAGKRGAGDGAAGDRDLAPGCWEVPSPAPWPSPVSRLLCPTAKPGYCYHIPEVEDPLHKDCGDCRGDASCSRCTSDIGCPGATKCCPSKCGYMCQEPVLDICYLPSVCGSCKALFRRFFFNASSQRCEEFIYGGCGGNRNNFETEGECFHACSHVVAGAR